MEDLKRLEIYDKVNKCKTFKELANIIRSLADDNGEIQGRTKKFSAKRMAEYCECYHSVPVNTLTREFGIRQQAMHIKYFTR